MAKKKGLKDKALEKFMGDEDRNGKKIGKKKSVKRARK